MSKWPSTKANRVYKALLRIGWIEPTTGKGGSHTKLTHPKFPASFTWAFHDSDEIGPKMLAKIAKTTGLTPEDL